jgi:hypothetical protein
MKAKQQQTIASQTRDFDQRNGESARLILADVEQYGGEAAGLVIWARMATRRIESERRVFA